MFMIERRTAGVLAALASTAAMAVVGNVWDRLDEVATPSTANSTAALATSVRPDLRHNHFLAGGQPGCAPASGTEPQAAPRVAVWPARVLNCLTPGEQANDSSAVPK
jgi:hypothetical protein